MSLTKPPLMTYVPGVPGSPGRPYSQRCPGFAPSSTPNTSPSTSGGFSTGGGSSDDNCYQVPVIVSVYSPTPVYDPYTGAWSNYTYEVGYQQVCYL